MTATLPLGPATPASKNAALTNTQNVYQIACNLILRGYSHPLRGGRPTAADVLWHAISLLEREMGVDTFEMDSRKLAAILPAIQDMLTDNEPGHSGWGGPSIWGTNKSVSAFDGVSLK